jgi:phosphoribosyl-dephospho-CoA transferase
VLLHIQIFVGSSYAESACSEVRKMTNDDSFINPMERSLLTDLVGLYTCDLSREPHQPCHARCIACSKEAIVRAILHYRELDALERAQALLQPQPFP